MNLAVDLTFSQARPEDAARVATLRGEVADRLTREFGLGQWSSSATERGVLNDLKISKVLVAWSGGRIIASLRLATRKPWAIDSSCFTACLQPLYLSDMAVSPDLQRSGIGRRCLQEASRMALAWPADAIRLDAYDAPAGAGAFYARCGYREVGRVNYRNTPLIYYECLL
jgi:GNAT superfamily N-acetyltransferase